MSAVGFVCPECAALPVARQGNYGVHVHCDRCGWDKNAKAVLEVMWTVNGRTKQSEAAT